jgi:hypothetical protein
LDKIGYKKKEGSSKGGAGEDTQRGLQDGWTRATFILRKVYLENLKELAYWERKTIKGVIDEALFSYLEGQKFSTQQK